MSDSQQALLRKLTLEISENISHYIMVRTDRNM